MKVLVLGGTKFLGRHLVQLALEAGCDITVFNRGQYAPQLFSQSSRAVHQLIGDRSSDLTALQQENWDVVYDLSGYQPEDVMATVALLGPRVERYVFVSTISVYLPGTTGSVDESAAVYSDGSGYAPWKALCEREVLALPGGDRGIVVRPGLIAGPFDPTYRFNYWLARVARGGAVLAPGRPGRCVQVIDARDLAAFVLRLGDLSLNAGLSGQAPTIGSGLNAPLSNRIFNAAGLAGSLSMQDLLQSIETVVRERKAPGVHHRHIPVRFCWVDDQQLVRRSISEWTELPLWIAEEGESANFYAVDSSKAVSLGLKYRPIVETVRDIYEQHPHLLNGDDDPGPLATISQAVEAAILAESVGGL